MYFEALAARLDDWRFKFPQEIRNEDSGFTQWSVVLVNFLLDHSAPPTSLHSRCGARILWVNFDQHPPLNCPAFLGQPVKERGPRFQRSTWRTSVHPFIVTPLSPQRERGGQRERERDRERERERESV